MKKLSFLVLICFASITIMQAQISGTVYRDFNGNGVRQTTAPNNEPGVPGIIVNAYDSTNALVSTAISNANGAYTMAFTVPVRLEFEIPSGNVCANSELDYTGFSGDGNNIRFVNASTSTLNYAIHLPDDYTANTNPFVFVPISTMGDPLGGGTSGSTVGYVGYTYNSTTTTTSTKTLPQSAMGSVWGGTYSKQAKKIFTSAFVKRQVGLGPLGSGGIYMLEPTATSFNVTQFYNMDANGYRTRAQAGAIAYGSGSSYSIASGTTITYNGSIDAESGLPEGLGVIGTNGTRGLPAAMNIDCYDPAAFDQVGKVGLGDIEISDDGKYLFIMNLYNRKLYRLELDNAYNPTSVISVTNYSLPAIAVSNGVLRPFAVTYHRGKIYVGAVSSGENGGVNNVGGVTDLYAYVFEMSDPTGTAAFNATPILNFPLNYQKGYSITTLKTNPDGKKWHPWSHNSSLYLIDGFQEMAWSSPMFSNIEFTDKGDMILDFMDRGGHQYGYNNYTSLNASGPIVNSFYDVSGDILIAGKNCGTGVYTLESNGSYNSNGTTLTGSANGEGPGGGEFFYLESLMLDEYHHETSQGAAAIVPGSRGGIFTLMDPVTAFSGGTGRFSTDNGTTSNRVTLYGSADGAAAKSNGLGDIEVAGDEAPIEVGNLVWADLTPNGIQDAGELGIANVTLNLYCDFDNDNIPDGGIIGTTTTNSSGQWYFNNSNVTDGDCTTIGNQLGLQANKTYIVQIASSDWSGGIGVADLAVHSLTTLNAPVIGLPDASDNDASLVANIPQIQFTTGNLGVNNHTYDFGFIPCSVDAGNNIALNCTTPSGVIGTPAVVGATYSWLPTTGLSSANVAQPTASPTTTTTYTLTINGICSDDVTVTVDNNLPTANAGSTMNLNCTTPSGAIGTTSIVGNTYSWAPSTGLSSSTDAQPTASPSITTTYTVTVTGTNGCSNTSTVLVNVDNMPPVADAGSSLFLNCTTPTGVLGTASISGNTYSWLPTSDLDNASIAKPTASPLTTLTYTVTVTGTNGCSETSTALVNVDNALPIANAGPNQTIYYGNNIVIGTTAIVGNTYNWLPATDLSNSTIAQPTANPTAPNTIYTVTATGANGCTETSSITIEVLLPKPTITSYPNSQYCFGDNTVLKASGLLGATFTWTMPVGVTGVIDNSVSGESTLTMIGMNATNNGAYTVSQSLVGYPVSATESIVVIGAAKAPINFVTTSCVSNNGEITVNATGSNLEYSLNGGAFQASNVMATMPGSAFIVGVKEVGSSCVNYYEGHCVTCMASLACTSPATDSIVAPDKTCADSPIAISGYFNNASTGAWSSSGTGTFSNTSCTSSPCTTSYTPSAADMLNGNVVITFTTDDPDGTGPCMPAMCSHNMELFNGTVSPSLSTNAPVCENSLLKLLATGAEGTIAWNGPSFNGTGDSISLANATASDGGLYTATASIAGCTNITPTSTSSITATVSAVPTLAVNAFGIPEACFGNGNGKIHVDVTGGSGSYTICYNGNLSNCSTDSIADFQWIAAGTYTVTVIDQICPNNVFSYPVVVSNGAILPPPVVSPSYTVCEGESLILSGTTTFPATDIIWVNAANNLNATGNPLVIQNATVGMSGNYYAKAIDGAGCASAQVGLTVEVFAKPAIAHVQVNCLGTSAEIDITANLTGNGTLSYSLDGSNWQTSNLYSGVAPGTYTLHVKNGTSNCETTLPISIPNCACPTAPILDITAPINSCSTTTIPVTANFSNVSNATWTSTGTGTYTTKSGISPLTSIYTPSAADIALGHVYLIATTDDPDGVGPCTPVSQSAYIILVDSLQTPIISTLNPSYCEGDTVVMVANGINSNVNWTGTGGYLSDSTSAVLNGATQFLSGIYTATASGNGCVTKSASYLLTVTAAPVLTITSTSVDENCEGHANGEITVNVSGGTGNYTLCDGLFINCANTTNQHSFKWLAPSTYTIYVADASCPNAQNSMTATINAGTHVDPPTAVSYNNPVCIGEDLIMNATGLIGSSFLWTDMANNFTATGSTVTRTPAEIGMTGTYKVQRVDNGCTSEPYLLDVKVFDNPSILNVDTLCVGSIDSGRITVNSSIAGGSEIEYSLNDGAYQSSNVFDNLTNGLYQIHARAVGSDCVTTMKELELYCACNCNRELDVNVFPNPSNGKFNVKASLFQDASSITLTVYDMSGRTIYEKSIEPITHQLNEEIDIAGYAAGGYLLRVVIDGERFLKPIIVHDKQ